MAVKGMNPKIKKAANLPVRLLKRPFLRHLQNKKESIINTNTTISQTNPK
jgi:hypothetical protein